MSDVTPLCGTWRWIVHFLRILFGTQYLLSGLNFYFGFLAIPEPANPVALQVMAAFVDSHMFEIAKGVEVVSGALLLSNRFVPFALVLAFPITVIVFYVDGFLINEFISGWLVGGVTMFLNSALMVGYFAYYRPMLRPRTVPTVTSVTDGARA